MPGAACFVCGQPKDPALHDNLCREDFEILADFWKDEHVFDPPQLDLRSSQPQPQPQQDSEPEPAGGADGSG